MKKTFFLLILFFTFSLNATPPVAIYLTWQRDPTTTMTIQWITHQTQEKEFLYYRKKGQTTWETASERPVGLPDDIPFILHRVELSNLSPNVAYDFQLSSETAIHKFRTLPKDLQQPIRFAVGGDIYHDTLDKVQEMNRTVAQKDPYFALLGGDLTYSAGRSAFLADIGLTKEKSNRWLEWLHSWTEDMITPDGFMIPMIPAIGNHDVMGGSNQTPDQAKFFYTLFPFPGQEGINALDFGDYLTLFVLDSGHTHTIKQQVPWLERNLAKRQNKLHKFALYHVAAYPSTRKYEGTTAQLIRKNWIPLFEKFGIQAVFENHDHAYKRTHPILNEKVDAKGIIYLGDGGWGVDMPRNPKTPKQRWYLTKAVQARNAILVTISNKMRYYEAIDESGKMIDSFKQTL